MNQQPQKPFFQEAKNSGGVLIELIHASVILLRLFSRVPGSIGGKLLFPGVFMSLLCFAILTQHPERSADLERPVITIAGWLWVIHMVAYFMSWRGKGTYAWHMGKGWLNILFPGANHQLFLALLSDGVVALALSAICSTDPGLSRYWLITAVLSFASHALIGSRDLMRRINVGSATDQQRHWQSHLPMENDLE